MSSIEANPPAAGTGDAQVLAPPGSKLVVVMFPDEAKVDQAIDAIITRLTAGEDIRVYGLAVVARGLDDKIAVQDITAGKARHCKCRRFSQRIDWSGWRPAWYSNRDRRRRITRVVDCARKRASFH